MYLNTAFKVKKTQGNYNNEIGMPLTILDLDKDTDISILEMGMAGFHEIEYHVRLLTRHSSTLILVNDTWMHQEAYRTNDRN